MKRVFVQSDAQFPHKGAQANYIQYLAQAIALTGVQPVMITGVNLEYLQEDQPMYYKDLCIIPIFPNIDQEKNKVQRQTGYTKERLGAMQQHDIGQNDVVIVFEIGYNHYFHKALKKLSQEIGFKVIVGSLEIYGCEDYMDASKYEKFIIAIDELFTQYDAVLAISSFAEEYYKQKGMKTYKFPPMIDCREYKVKTKQMDKLRFIIFAGKDSLDAMLYAFAGLKPEELQKLELHLCGISETNAVEILGLEKWRKLELYIIFHSWLKYEQLTELYQQMHFLVIARGISRRTLANFPSKIPEVMSYGIVPIASEVGDYTKYYLQDGYNSIFINGDTAQEVRKAVRKALAMKKEEYSVFSKRARQCAEERFDCRVWTSEIKKMLDTV